MLCSNNHLYKRLHFNIQSLLYTFDFLSCTTVTPPLHCNMGILVRHVVKKLQNKSDLNHLIHFWSWNAAATPLILTASCGWFVGNAVWCSCSRCARVKQSGLERSRLLAGSSLCYSLDNWQQGGRARRPASNTRLLVDGGWWARRWWTGTTPITLCCARCSRGK